MARFPTRRELSPTTGGSEDDSKLDGDEEFGEEKYEAVAAAPAPKVAVPVVPAKRWRVTNHTPIAILYDGYNALIRPGKIFDEHVYDVDRLRKQGVTLEEMVD